MDGATHGLLPPLGGGAETLPLGHWNCSYKGVRPVSIAVHWPSGDFSAAKGLSEQGQQPDIRSSQGQTGNNILQKRGRGLLLLLSEKLGRIVPLICHFASSLKSPSHL